LTARHGDLVADASAEAVATHAGCPLPLQLRALERGDHPRLRGLGRCLDSLQQPDSISVATVPVGWFRH